MIWGTIPLRRRRRRQIVKINVRRSTTSRSFPCLAGKRLTSKWPSRSLAYRSLTLTLGSGQIRVTVAASNPTIPDGKLEFTSIGGASLTNNKSSFVTIQGTLSAVNNTLGTLKYTSDELGTNLTIVETITVNANDLGNTACSPTRRGHQVV